MDVEAVNGACLKVRKVENHMQNMTPHPQGYTNASKAFAPRSGLHSIYLGI